MRHEEVTGCCRIGRIRRRRHARGCAGRQADQLGYIINVTVRPTYNFPNAQVALDYGYGLCGRIEEKVSYTDMAAQIKSDFNTNDEFTVSYLLSQAAQELCPGQTWQLRQSAAGYKPF